MMNRNLLRVATSAGIAATLSAHAQDAPPLKPAPAQAAPPAAAPLPQIPTPADSPVRIERRRPHEKPEFQGGKVLPGPMNPLPPNRGAGLGGGSNGARLVDHPPMSTPFGITVPQVTSVNNTAGTAALTDFRTNLARSGHFGSGVGKTPLSSDGVPQLTASVQLPTTSGVSFGSGGQCIGMFSQAGVMVDANPTWSTGGYSIGRDQGSVRYDEKSGRYTRISPRRDPALSRFYQPDELARVAATEDVPPPPPVDPWDHAAALLNARQFAQAAKALAEIAKADPEDLDARIWQGVALVLDKKFEDGAARITAAYRDDPNMAAEPLNFATLPAITPADLRTAQSALANRGNIAKSAECFVASAIFAQARAKAPEALDMLKKARELGLDALFAGQLMQKLGA